MANKVMNWPELKNTFQTFQPGKDSANAPTHDRTTRITKDKAMSVDATQKVDADWNKPYRSNVLKRNQGESLENNNDKVPIGTEKLRS
jgi:hypothetical protein